MASRSINEIDKVVNENLRNELGVLEKALNKINDEIIEYMQLEKTLEFMKEHKSDGFKTKVDIGANMFMQAKVENIEPILINIGLNVFLELQMGEALKYLKMKIKILHKEAEVIRDESLKIRSKIKVLLMYLAEKQNLNLPMNKS